MHDRFSSKGASISGAPFAFWPHILGVILLGCYGHGLHAGECAADRISERVQVVHVHDGDTVKLQDGRRVRLIGINTPETARNEQSPQPFATEARTALKSMLDTSSRHVLLQYGKQHRDHYGRVLAHVFLENGDNVAARLLQQGLATALVVPPNSWGRSCYQQLENTARSERRGIWGLDAYQSKPAGSLPPSARGFHIVNGKVDEIRHSRHSVWVDLEGPLVVHISRKDLVNFTPAFLSQLEGQPVEVRGWIKQDRSGLRINVRHPAALLIIQ